VEPESPKPEPRRRRKWVIAGAILLVLLALGAAGLDHWLPYMLLSHYKFAVDPAPPILGRYGAEAERLSFKTSDGLTIRGWFIAAPKKTLAKPTTLIVLHTLGRTRQEMLEFSLPLWQRGFNLAMIDMRGHGESDAEFFTYGYHEWRDVVGLIDWLEKREGVAADRIALLGASAGGAVAISAAARDRRVKALVSIASFADLEEMIVRRSPWLPACWRGRAIGKAERMADFKVREVSPEKMAREVKCPVFVAHGDLDVNAPYAHAERIFAAAMGPKKLYRIRGADHDSMFARGGDQLRAAIAEFVLAAFETPEP
jgi:dipeptidyl aminopeptidase/acylaminoacyl peptidase